MVVPPMTTPAPGLTIRFETIRDPSAIERLEKDYARLQGATGNPLPFALFGWHLTWCRHFLGSHGSIEDSALFQVARNAAGHCVAIIPMVLTRRRLGFLRIASLSLLGADPAITEIRTPLIEPGYEELVAYSLRGALRPAAEWDWIHWSVPPGRFAAALGEARSLTWKPGPPSYVLDLPATWQEFRAGLKRNIRESLRHCYNSLKRDKLEFEFRIAASQEAVPPALNRLFQLHRLRAGMSGSAPHPDRFASPALRNFAHEMCVRLAATGHVRIFELAIAERVVAARIAFVVADSLYLYYSGFDPAWSRYSVMTTTVAEAIQYAISEGLTTVNLSPGKDVSKTRWGPREVPHYHAYEDSGRLRSRLIGHAYLKAVAGEGVQGWLLQRLAPGRRPWT